MFGPAFVGPRTRYDRASPKHIGLPSRLAWLFKANATYESCRATEGPKAGARPPCDATAAQAVSLLTPGVALLSGRFVELAVFIFTALTGCGDGLCQSVE